MLTELEKVVIKIIAKNEYSDKPGDSVWTFIIEDNTDLHSKQISGVVSSLTKKGLVDSNDEGKDSTIWLTENGIKEYETLKMKSIEDLEPIMCSKFGHCKATKKCPIEKLLTEQAGNVYKIVLPNGKTCKVYYKGLMESKK